MKGFYLFALCLGLASAAIQPGPVYRSATSVGSSAKNQQPNNNPQLVNPVQPSAEERESTGGFQVTDSATKTATGGSTGGTSNTAATASPSPTTYMVHYYSGHPASQTYNPASANTVYQQPGNTVYSQPATQNTAYSQQTGNTGVAYQQQPAVDIWNRYYIKEILVGGAALGLVLGGSSILYPKLWNVKQRALRELSELKVEDANRMVKGVMRALEKYYEMNAKKE